MVGFLSFFFCQLLQLKLFFLLVMVHTTQPVDSVKFEVFFLGDLGPQTVR
jgi:hypothetical protein